MVRNDPQIIRAALNTGGMRVEPGTSVEVLKTLAAYMPKFEQLYDGCYQLRAEIRREVGKALCERLLEDFDNSGLYTAQYLDGLAEGIGDVITGGTVRLARDETSLRAAEVLKDYGHELYCML